MFTSVRSAILLGSSAAAMLAAIGAAFAEDSGAQMLVPPATMAQAARTHLIEGGQLSNIPQGSPLRSELPFTAGAAQESPRSLTLLALVEADPNRTVQALSPVAGPAVDSK